jgi:RNA-directed DNA polymerase
MRQNMERGKELWMIFLDLKSAYNQVDRRILIRYIEDNRILEGDKLLMLKILMTNLKIRLGEMSMRTTNGVPQGSTISPFLFNISMIGFMKLLQENGISFKMFADDIVLYAELGRLRDVLRKAEIWNNNHNMLINK